jgi:hypothetical protein
VKSTSKKGSQKLTRKPQSQPIQKKRIASKDPSQLARENETLRGQLAESLQRENATSEILSAIANSAKDLQRVLDTVAENAARLCEAKESLIFRIEGDFYQRVARYGSMYTGGGRRPITLRTPIGRAMLDRQTTIDFRFPKALSPRFI